MKSLLTFPKGGVHPPEFKAQTQGLAIEVMPVPDELEIILGQHISAPCTATVAKRDVVAEAALLGEVKKGLGVPLHAPAAGKIKNLATSAHPVRVSSPSITLVVDKEAEAVQYQKRDWQQLSSSDLLAKIHDAGIIGIGGAGFPTHVKLNPPANSPVDTLVLNGAECEPYITADHRQMLENPTEIVEGAQIILKILGISECHIGIESNKPDAVLEMEKAVKDVPGADTIKIQTLQVKYPQGSEKQLIQAVTGRKVPAMALPSSVGVVVQNVTTAKAVYDAVVYGKPLYEKVVTIA